LLGTISIVTEVVAAVSNALGFTVDLTAVIDVIMSAHMLTQAHAGRVRQIEQRYLEQGVEAGWRAGRPRRRVEQRTLKTDIVAVVVTAAYECMKRSSSRRPSTGGPWSPV
jgi:hypothetical protein